MNKIIKQNEQGKRELDVAISKSTKNKIVLIISIIIISILSGMLGAFKNGEFQKTYDFVLVETPLSEINFDDQIFDNLTRHSRVVIVQKDYIRYDEVSGESYLETIDFYEGYYTKYFFASSWFYLETLFNMLLIFIFYVSLSNYLISKKEEKDEVYISLTSQINGLTIQDNAVPASSFEPFMEDWNDKRKIKQYISNKKYEIAKLELKTSYRIRNKFLERNEETKKLEFKVPKDKSKLNKKELKYLNQKQKLYSELDPEYVEENALYQNVKFFKYIHPSFVTTGQNGNQNIVDEYSANKGDKEAYGSDLFSKMAIIFLITGAVAVLLSFTMIRTTDEVWSIMLAVLLQFLPLLLQIILAIDYSNTYMKFQLIPTLRQRLNIINLYLVERKKYVVDLEIKPEEPKQEEPSDEESDEKEGEEDGKTME